MWAESDSAFGFLPVELKWKIFGFLNNSDKKRTRLVCSAWQSIVDENFRCRVLLTNQTMDLFLACRCHLKSMTIQNLTKIISLSSLQNTSPRLDECVIGEDNSSQNILTILQFYSNQIDRLRIQNMSLSKIKNESLSRVLHNAEWSNLSTLSLTMGSTKVVYEYEYTISQIQIRNHAQATLQILKSMKIPTLQNLTINFFRGLYIVKIWDDVFEFILNHRWSLQELVLAFFGKPKPPPLADFELFSKFSDLTLKKFVVKFDVLHASYANALCLQMKVLDQLEIEADRDPVLDFHFVPPMYTGIFRIPEIFDVHKKTLRVLRCQCVTFDVQWLTGFDSLKTLELIVDRLDIRPSTSLYCLQRFSLVKKGFADNELNLSLLIEYIIGQMQNLNEMELLGHYYHYRFQASHLKNLVKNLRRLRKITVQPWNEYTSYTGNIFMDFCRNTPGISFKIEDVKSNNWLQQRVKRAVIQLNRIVTLSHNGVDYKCYRW